MKRKLLLSGLLLTLATGSFGAAQVAAEAPSGPPPAPAEGSFCLALPVTHTRDDGTLGKSYWGLIAGTPEADQVGGIVLSVYSSSRSTDFYALYLALAVASTRDNFGMEFSPVLGFADNNYGLLPATFGIVGANYGAYMGFLTAIASENYGLSLSGIANIAYRNYGAQLGIANRVVAENRGLQLGVYNHAAPEAPNGIRAPFEEAYAEDPPNADAKNFLQIGIFNCNRFHGPSLQIGLLNYDATARFPWLPFCNWK